MKGKETIINFIVSVALIGYILCSFLLFKEAFGGKENSALMHITSALTGLVGGIVAAAFGVKSEDREPTLQQQSIREIKFQRVGAYVYPTQDVKTKEKMGNLYAWAYIVVGIFSLIVWAILNENATQSITNTGMTFLGMIVAIVGAFFKE